MRYILIIFSVFLLSLTVISCAKIDEGSVCLNINSKVRKVLQEKTTFCDRSESSSSADGLTGTYQLATNDYANGVAIQSDGKIVVVGYSGSDFAVVRYDTDGLPHARNGWTFDAQEVVTPPSLGESTRGPADIGDGPRYVDGGGPFWRHRLSIKTCAAPKDPREGRQVSFIALMREYLP